VAQSVAVLPFANTSGQAENEHFSDGLTDELIGALSKVRGLRVAARTSAFALKGRGLDVRTIADTLGVDHVLEGSVRRDGNRLKVSAQLVSAGDNGVVWSDSWDREMIDVFAVQEEIARAIVEALNVRLSASEGARLVGRPTANLEAYDLYLRGRYNWSLRTRERLEEAIANFVEATQRDPTFALPYIALADAYVNMSNFDFMAPDVALARAKVAADRALELDPTLAEAYSSQGFVLASRREFAASEAAFRRSIELNASYPWSHHFYSLLLLMLGRVDEAIAQNRQALVLDPLSLPANAAQGIILSMLRDHEGAARELRQALALGPTFPLTLFSLGLELTSQGAHAEALPLLTRAVELAPGFPGAKSALLYTYSRLGQQRAADSLLAEMRAAADDNRARLILAFGHAVLKDNDAAFALLDRVEWDVPSLIEIRANPLLDALRADPRYAEVLGRMGLQP
jgi:serine/threonine-protein kinase